MLSLASRGLSLALILAIAAPVSAAPATDAPVSPEVDRALSEAAAAFDAGNFEAAVAGYERAYALSPDPNFLYNIGRIHEEAANLEAAVDYYGRFAREPGVSLELRTQALERRKALKAILSETREEPEPTPEPTPAPTVVTAPATTDAPEVDRNAGEGLRITGYVLLGVGAVALATGGVFGGLARNDAVDLDDSDDPDARQDLFDSGRTRARTADAMFVTGGLLAVTGAVLLAVGLTRPRARARRAAFLPSVGPRGAHAAVRVRF